MSLTLLLILSFMNSVFADQESIGYTHKKCEALDEGKVVLPIQLESQKVIPECAPEVLYVWQNLKIIQYYEKKSQEGEFFPVHSPLVTWRTPLGEFAFGDYLIRIKLKPNLKFFLNAGEWEETGGCKYLSDEDKKNTIIFGYYSGGKNFSDYVICSPEVIHSWSYGTPKIHQELLQEYVWVKMHEDQLDLFDRPYKTRKTESFTDQDYDATAFFKFKRNSLNWSETEVLKRLKLHEALLDQVQPTQIHFREGEPNFPKLHDCVSYPDYFNDNRNCQEKAIHINTKKVKKRSKH